MTKKHNNLKRLIHRSLEEVKASYDVARAISLSAACVIFRAKIDIQIMNRNGLKEPADVKRRLLKKHDIMINYLEKKFESYWRTYQITQEVQDCDSNLRNKIWICWWQGIDNAPDIVKVCVQSIKKNYNEKDIIFITEDNYANYVTFPKWVEEKRMKGVFSRTHFSDLLRMNLLATYGGIWIDSTFLCNGSCFSDYIKLPLWSIKRPDYAHCSVACGYFAGYSLGCNYENRWVFKVIRDFLFNYWKECDKLIDYLLVDYAVVLSQRHCEQIAVLFKQIEPNNPCCDELFKVLGDPYNEQLWQNLKKKTSLFKLTWKQDFPKQIDGVPTFYGKLISNLLK